MVAETDTKKYIKNIKMLVCLCHTYVCYTYLKNTNRKTTNFVGQWR